jgi:soluble lytic murein transglycosylase
MGAALALTLLLGASADRMVQAGVRVEAGDPLGALAVLDGIRGRAASYLSGRANEILGDYAAAASDYARALPFLAEEVGVRLGEVLLETGRLPAARRAFARVLRDVRERPSRFRARALLGIVRSQARAGRCTAAERDLWALSKEHGTNIQDRALLAVARCLERKGALEAAAALYDRVAGFHPRGEPADQARRALATLARQDVRPPVPSAEEAVRAARRLRRANRLEEARARLDAIRDPGPQERLVRFERAEILHAAGDHRGAIPAFRTLFRERPREPGASGYLRLAARCHAEIGEHRQAGEAWLQADAATPPAWRNGRDLWLAGTAFDRAAEPERSADAFLRFAKRERRSRHAPRAWVRAAEVLIAHGRFSRSARVAAELPRFFGGRAAWRARWLAAWARFRGGDLPGARAALAAIAAARRAPGLDALRARYWAARVAEASDARAAVSAYEALRREEPTSFYADLAEARLRALGIAVQRATAAPLARARAASLPASPAPPRAPILRELARDLPDLARAMTLLRLGLRGEAQEALVAAQDEVERARRRPANPRAFRPAAAAPAPSGWRAERRARLARIDRAALGLALVPLLEKAGARGRALENRRRFGRALEGRRAGRQGAFPRVYEDLVGAAAARHGLEPALLFAVIRQESASAPTRFRTRALAACFRSCRGRPATSPVVSARRRSPSACSMTRRCPSVSGPGTCGSSSTSTKGSSPWPSPPTTPGRRT